MKSWFLGTNDSELQWGSDMCRAAPVASVVGVLACPLGGGCTNEVRENTT